MIPQFVNMIGSYYATAISNAVSLQAAPRQTPSGFWGENWDKILIPIITAIVVLILSESIKAALRSIGGKIEISLSSLKWRFRKRYLAALEERHRWLKLIGFYNSARVHPPRLQEAGHRSGAGMWNRPDSAALRDRTLEKTRTSSP